ncbi:hypothetical protein HD806DRAFT_512191 [Xylariaceae sp. AK1471]|nr:hypothetical protein HD806DRAFT_512191 [Xylariaceae sp. AK1471]
MQLSNEAIVAIIALLVALPPAIVIMLQLLYRFRSRHFVREPPRELGTTAEMELEPILRVPATSPMQPSPLNPAWRTTSIRMVFEDGSQRHCFEIKRDQPSEDLVNSQPNVPLLLGRQSMDHDSAMESSAAGGRTLTDIG